MDYKIKDKIWNGSVNIIITLPVEASQSSKSQTIEYLLTMHRNSYLPIYFDTIINYFKNFTQFKEPIWLEYDGYPIKWNLPVGLLYDSLHTTTPWKLTFKYGTYPEDLIPFIYRYPDETINYEKSIMENYFNQLKQASYIINGNAKLVMNLSKDDSENYWHAIKSHNLDDYTNISKKLSPNKLLKIPIKLYVDNKILHFPIPPDALFQVIMDKFPHKKFYIHGINITIDNDIRTVKVLDIWTKFKYLDDFLYIIIY